MKTLIQLISKHTKISKPLVLVCFYFLKVKSIYNESNMIQPLIRLQSYLGDDDE